jgi:hypothetical protein
MISEEGHSQSIRFPGAFTGFQQGGGAIYTGQASAFRVFGPVVGERHAPDSLGFVLVLDPARATNLAVA